MSVFSFLERKKSVDLSPYMRRICDLSVPNRCGLTRQARTEDRYNRTITVLVCPWNSGRPVSEQAAFATTKDISDRGVSVVTPEPIEGEFVVAFASPESEECEPWHFLGQAKRSASLGGGFWVTGIEFSEFASANYRRELQVLYPLACRLRPDAST